MPLLKETYQPFYTDPGSPAPKSCGESFCNFVNLGDSIYQQWRQTPCGNNEIADPNFDNVAYGPEMVTNGDFSLPFAPDWTALDWTLVSGQAQGPISSFANDLRQTVAFTGSIAFYRLQVTVSGLSPGDYVDVYVGNLGAFYRIDQNGVFDQIVRSGTAFDLIFVAGANNLANVLLDNVSLTTVTFGDWLLNGTWTLQLGQGIACADASGTGLLEEDVVDYIVAGDYYLLTFTISNYLAGTLTPNVADIAGAAVSANGDYEIYLTPTATGVVSFLPSADFSGCISNVNLQVLRNDFLFEVIDEDGNRYDISHWMEYYEDKVTLNSPVFDLLEIPYGCYTIEVTDRCLVEGIELVTNGDFAEGYDSWTRNNGFDQYDLNAGVLEFVFEPLEGATRVANGDFSGGATDWTVGAGWAIGGGAATHTPGNTATLSQIVNTSAPSVPPNVLVHWFQFTITNRTAGSVTVTLSDQTSIAFTTNQIITARLIPTIGGAVTLAFTPSNDFDGDISAIALHEATRPWSDFVIIRNVANADMVQGNYALEYDLATNTTVQTNGSVGIGIVGMTQSLTYDTAVGIQTRSITNYTPGAQEVYMVARFSQSGVFFPGRIGVDNVSAVRVEPFEATYTSECMYFALSHPGTYLVTGWCDQESFGFNFLDADFKLQIRLLCRSFNTTIPNDTLIAKTGDGNARLTYAQIEKYWLFTTSFLSETALTALAAISRCNHFTIGTSAADAQEYVVEVEEYSPAWRPDGDHNLAIGQLTIRKAEGGMKFNRPI